MKSLVKFRITEFDGREPQSSCYISSSHIFASYFVEMTPLYLPLSSLLLRSVILLFFFDTLPRDKKVQSSHTDIQLPSTSIGCFRFTFDPHYTSVSLEDNSEAHQRSTPRPRPHPRPRSLLLITVPTPRFIISG